MAHTKKNGADPLAGLRAAVAELRARVERLERARAGKGRAENQPVATPRVLSLDDPEQAKDAEFIHPLLRRAQRP